MIVLENVTKTYQMGETSVVALRGVSLRVEQGEFVSLVGASGSGKSTLLHMIGLLDRPDTGALYINNRNTGELPDDEMARLRSETIGFVFQQFHLLKRITAFENVELPLIYARGDQPAANPEDLLKRVGLEQRSGHRPNELSGGQQQRVAIARALVRRPQIVLADEPTGNLDSHSGAEIMALLRELHAAGLTVILVTHEPSIAATADRIIRVHDGEIIEDVRKPAAELKPAPVTAAPLPEFVLTPKRRLDVMLINIEQAVRGLWSNKLRTCLSTLGIIIGVAAVIVMLALGSATLASVEKTFEKLGANKMYVIPNWQWTAGVRQNAVSRLTVDDLMSIDGRLPTVAGVSGGIRGTVQVVYGHNNASTTLYGASPGYVSIYDSAPTYGRFFTLEECRQRTRVAVIGTTVISTLFGNKDPIGQTIQVNHVPFLIIGTLPSKGSAGNDDLDDRVVVPLQTAMFRVFGSRYMSWIDVTSATPDEVDATQKQVEDLTRTWPRVPGVPYDSYKVTSMKAQTQGLNNIFLAVSLLLTGVAAISLVVGGIGIMNIMLVSVTERTREIGLRKALGARGRDIKMQFLIESVALCLSGGFLGIALGWIISLGIGYCLGIWLNPAPLSVLISCGFSVGVGIGFGYWPAVQASRLNAIEALRYE